MPKSDENDLKAFLNKCFKGDQKSLFIQVREIRKSLLDLKIKEEGKVYDRNLKSGEGAIEKKYYTPKAEVPYASTIPKKNRTMQKTNKTEGKKTFFRLAFPFK